MYNQNQHQSFSLQIGFIFKFEQTGKTTGAIVQQKLIAPTPLPSQALLFFLFASITDLICPNNVILQLVSVHLLGYCYPFSFAISCIVDHCLIYSQGTLAKVTDGAAA